MASLSPRRPMTGSETYLLLFGSLLTTTLLLTGLPVATLNSLTRKPMSAGWLFASTAAMKPVVAPGAIWTCGRQWRALFEKRWTQLILTELSGLTEIE